MSGKHALNRRAVCSRRSEYTIIRHQEDFLPEEEVAPKRKATRKKVHKNRYHNAA